MANQTSKTFLVETDFLFGLRADDPLHPFVLTALRQNLKRKMKIFISSPAIIEASVVMLSQGLDFTIAAKALDLMSSKLSQYGLKRLSRMGTEEAGKAFLLRFQNSHLGFFDSLHAAVALKSGFTVLSSDNIYEEIGVEFRDLQGLRQSQS